MNSDMKDRTVCSLPGEQLLSANHGTNGNKARTLDFAAALSTVRATTLRSFCILLLSLLSKAGFAQVCSINIGADHTICQGQTTQLLGPPGYASYLWSTGAISQNITVGAAGDYWCQVSYPSGNLVTNGNFSAGNAGFSTEFNYAFDLTSEGTYTVGLNANWYHPQWSGTGSGNFLMVNAGWVSNQNNQISCWCQTENVCPQQTYTISYNARTLSNAIPARLQWFVDGVPTGPQVNLPAFSAGWQNVSTTWTRCGLRYR